MHTFSSCSVSFVFLWLSVFAQSTVTSTGDITDIRDVVQRYMDAREKMDPIALKELFTSDADQLVSTGEWRKGLSEIIQGTLASSLKTGGKRTIDVVSVRFVGPGVAIVDARYEISNLAEGQARKMWTTLILMRSSDHWRIAAIRNMLPAAPAPSK